MPLLRQKLKQVICSYRPIQFYENPFINCFETEMSVPKKFVNWNRVIIVSTIWNQRRSATSHSIIVTRISIESLSRIIMVLVFTTRFIFCADQIDKSDFSKDMLSCLKLEKAHLVLHNNRDLMDLILIRLRGWNDPCCIKCL